MFMIPLPHGKLLVNTVISSIIRTEQNFALQKTPIVVQSINQVRSIKELAPLITFGASKEKTCGLRHLVIERTCYIASFYWDFIQQPFQMTPGITAINSCSSAFVP
jgi:hypothetical protein